MSRYVISRLAQVVPVILLVSAMTFFLVHILPGDLVVARLGASASPADVARLRSQLHLDEPLVLQYFGWLRSILSGDPGTSLVSNESVGTVLWDRLPVTIELVILATVLACAFGIPLGTFAALHQRSPLDYVVRVLAIVGQAVPNYWLGIIALTYMSIYFGWIPPTTYSSPLAHPVDNLEQFALPALIIGYGLGAVVIRYTRASLISIVRQDYVRTATAKGLTHRSIVARHIIRNGLLPVVTLVGVQFTMLVGGTVIIETVFSLPGIGSLTLQAIQNRDYVQIEFNVLIVAIIVVVANMIIDGIGVTLDPRIRS